MILRTAPLVLLSLAGCVTGDDPSNPGDVSDLTTCTPAATTRPSISGSAVVGDVLTGNQGTWSGTTPITYTLYWERCDTTGANCTVITSGSATTYTLQSADLGHTIVFNVKAVNSCGTGWMKSLPTAVVATGCAGPSNPKTDRLFACDSPWNKPIPSPAPIHPSSATMVQGIVAAHYPNNPMYLVWPDFRVDYPTSATPNVTVVLDFPSCGSKTFQVPITGTVQPYGSTARESRYVVLHADGRYWEFWKMTSPSQTPMTGCAGGDGKWHAEVVAVHPVDSSDSGWKGTGYCLPNTACRNFKASNLPEAASLRLRDYNVAAGATWDHALEINLRNISKASTNAWGVPYVFPASSTDGKCYTVSGAALPENECIPDGARLQLDPSIDCDTWPSLVNAAEWKRIECRTMQKYGAIVVDTGGGVTNEDDHALLEGKLGFTATDYIPPWDLVAHLRVVDWNKWTGN